MFQNHFDDVLLIAGEYISRWREKLLDVEGGLEDELEIIGKIVTERRYERRKTRRKDN